MRIAQISDLHVTDRDDGLRRFVDSNASLATAIAALRDHRSAPDVLLATGDLVEDGSRHEYRLLRDLLAPLELPLYPIPGNHDDSRAFAQAFDDLLPTGRADGHASYVVDHHEVRLVGLDTTVPDTHDGVFPEDRAAWLDTTLAAGADRPTLLFMHHPPFRTGIRWMDEIGLGDADRFREVLAGHPQVGQVVCGHIHRPIQTVVGSTLVSVCPSTAHQVGLDLVPVGSPYVTDEPPGFQVHYFDGQRFVTHTSPLPWQGRELDLSTLLADMASLVDDAGHLDP